MKHSVLDQSEMLGMGFSDYMKFKSALESQQEQGVVNGRSSLTKWKVSSFENLALKALFCSATL